MFASPVVAGTLVFRFGESSAVDFVSVFREASAADRQSMVCRGLVDGAKATPPLTGLTEIFLELSKIDGAATVEGLRDAVANGDRMAAFWLANLLARVDSASAGQKFLFDYLQNSDAVTRHQYAAQLARFCCMANDADSARAFEFAAGNMRDDAQRSIYRAIAAGRIPELGLPP